MLAVKRSVEDLRAVHHDLDGLPHTNADTQVPLFSVVVRSRPEVLEPRVLLSGEPPSAALFARLESRRLPLRVAFRTLFSLEARTLAVVPDGVVGSDPQHALADEALDAVRRGEVDLVHFMSVRCDSDLARHLQHQRSSMSMEISLSVVNLQTNVERNYLDTVAGRDSRQREAIRRAQRKLTKTPGAEIVRYPADESDPEQLLEALEEVSSRGYQRGMGVGFERDEFHEEAVRAGLREGWFRAWILTVEGVSRAYWTAFCFGSRWTLYETGFDDAFASSAPGTGLLCTVMEEACADPAVEQVSFGNGDARYKRDWADQDWLTEDVLVFSRRPKWMLFAWSQRWLNRALAAVRSGLGDDRVAQLRSRVRKRAASAARRRSS